MNDVVVVHYVSQRTANWRLLQRAAATLGVALTSWEPHRIAVVVSDDVTIVTYDGEPVSPRVLLHRTVSPFPGVMAAAAYHWRRQSTLVLNDVDASFRTRDKVLSQLALRDAGVPIVTTVVFDEPPASTLQDLSDGAVILKPAHGVRGEGIESFVDGKTLAVDWGLGEARTGRRTEPGYHVVREHYLAQPLIRGGGSDLRAFVVGDECVALMRRHAQPGEFRANLELGATGEALPLDHPATTTAVRALRACGLDYGGVDLIEDDDGVIRVLEVDAWAGFAGIVACTGTDVAAAILQLALRRCQTASGS